MLDFCLETLGSFLSPGTSTAVGAAKAVQSVYKSSEKKTAVRHNAAMAASKKREEELKRELEESQSMLADAIDFIKGT